MAEVQLLGFWYSPFTQRVAWALKIKQIKYKYIEVDQDKTNPLLLQHNPIYKQVPVLIHNDKAICGSMVILEYISETFDQGTSILPEDTHDRALARFWANYLHNKMETVWNAFFGKGEVQEKSKGEVCEMLKILDKELKGKEFFVANEFGFADIVANMVGFWLGVYQEVSGVELVTKKKFPFFCVWRDEYVKCSQVKEHLPSRDKLIAFYQAFARPQAAASASTQGISILIGP
ncbi:probable glutathione S-transferase isoform X1 [Solanum stenotomum]|uniref:probable glutathione S-transferase isoform X1 n=1 Tax=Solanum stenotomum TaxID=172797 RepID=UPI0020D00B2F|nr:probable glutathione S-transferase isoform X1 [Solanum stenotomum]